MTNECHFERLEDRRLLSGLLGINLEFPQGPYDATGVVNISNDHQVTIVT